MNNGGEAADQMVREALQFSEVAIKLTALGFKNSLAIAPRCAARQVLTAYCARARR